MGLRQLFKELLLEAEAAPASSDAQQPAGRNGLPEECRWLSADDIAALDAELALSVRTQEHAMAFRTAACTLQRGHLWGAIYQYRKLAGHFPRFRQDSEGQCGIAYYCLGQYRKAIDCFLAARVHGADADWMDENIWDACETLFLHCQDPVSCREPLDLYLRLCPRGAYREQAEGLLRHPKALGVA